MEQTLVAVLVVIVLAVALIRGGRRLKEWLDNNKQPEEPHEVRVTSKRKETTRRRSPGRPGGGISIGRSHTSETYYVTLELEDGRRQEFRIKGHQYAEMAEEDTGTAVLQGTRLVSFTREGAGS
ncbi:DUF2500 domain-containing protein [Alkalicoccus chagannorensis]|uniref:DUF2500 domain-containing protein n=1 Tax=Alkalicoccus chagannorensis TaxID=427072 RepID=UPI000418078D|nr:DUF2500 domain-containing protein [Alkalicoccus chagannorensis]